MVICDTNIFISAFNGIENAMEILERIGYNEVLMSSVTVMELYRGMKNKDQMAQMAKRIKDYNVVDFNEAISERSVELMRHYKLSHNLDIPDAIIAATCIVFDIPLFTYNIKDFKFIPGINLYEPQA
jgi:predicted nucleic acid-binding protein